jgi:uroporphyrinogen-III synthase
MMNPDEQNILNGKIIIRTYPEKGPDELTEILGAAGALVLSMPMVAIEPLPFHLKNDINEYDWLIFTSKNAVAPFFSHCAIAPGNRIAALGPGTASALGKQGCLPLFTGKGNSAVHFAEELRRVILPGKRILLVLGTLAPDTLESGLSASHSVERVNVYQTMMPKQVNSELLKRVEDDRYDLLIVSSPSAIRNLWTMLSGKKQNLRIISIGRTTSAAIRELHIEPVATSDTPGYRELAETTINYLMNEL